MRIEYNKYIQSQAWKAKSGAAMARAAFKCQVCSWPHHLAAHHNTYDRLGKELDSDLVVLCEKCHRLFHRVRDGQATRHPNSGAKLRKEIKKAKNIRRKSRCWSGAKAKRIAAALEQRKAWANDPVMTQVYGGEPKHSEITDEELEHLKACASS